MIQYAYVDYYGNKIILYGNDAAETKVWTLVSAAFVFRERMRITE